MGRIISDAWKKNVINNLRVKFVESVWSGGADDARIRIIN